MNSHNGTVQKIPREAAPARLASSRRLQTGLFFRLLPYQILLIVISAANGIVDSLYVLGMNVLVMRIYILYSACNLRTKYDP